MVIWKFLKETIYDNIDGGIRDIENPFMVGLMWILFNGFILCGLLWLAYNIYLNWHLGAWIVSVWIGIEILYWLGEHLQG